jgi:hypothetical protein
MNETMGISMYNSQPLLLIQALAEVKTSCRCNMFNYACVAILRRSHFVNALRDLDYKFEADWLEQHRDSYVAVLHEFSQWWQANRQESLAQQVARECGLEVIID